MKENFFKIGYSTYLSKEKKNKRTSFFWKKILEHKVIFSVIFVIFLCGVMNAVLIYRFMNILENAF